MLEEHAKRNAILCAAGERRDVLGDGIVEANLALVEQDHEGGRRSHDLREGSEIVNRAIGRDGRAGLLPAQSFPKPFCHHGRAAPSDDDGRARE